MLHTLTCLPNLFDFTVVSAMVCSVMSKLSTRFKHSVNITDASSECNVVDLFKFNCLKYFTCASNDANLTILHFGSRAAVHSFVHHLCSLLVGKPCLIYLEDIGFSC